MSRRPFPEAALVALVVLLVAFAPRAASAHGTPGTSGAARPEIPTPPPGEGRRAKAIVDALSPALRDPSRARIVRRPLFEARRALERAAGARAASDPARARLLDGLALEWAETARDLERAAALEAKAAIAGSRALALAERVARSRALLAETQARRGQVALELERTGAGKAPPGAPPSEGKPEGPAPKPVSKPVPKKAAP